MYIYVYKFMASTQLPLHLQVHLCSCGVHQGCSHPFVVSIAVMRPGDGRVLNCHLAPQLQQNDAGVQLCFGATQVVCPIDIILTWQLWKIFQVFMLEIPGTFGVSSVKSSKTSPKSVSTAWSPITHTIHNPQKTTSPPNLSSLKLPRHPKAFLCRGFPHVAQLTLPWTRIIGPDIGAQTPHATQLLRDFLAQEPDGLQEIQVDFLRIWGNLKTQPASPNH